MLYIIYIFLDFLNIGNWMVAIDTKEFQFIYYFPKWDFFSPWTKLLQSNQKSCWKNIVRSDLFQYLLSACQTEVEPNRKLRNQETSLKMIFSCLSYWLINFSAILPDTFSSFSSSFSLRSPSMTLLKLKRCKIYSFIYYWSFNKKNINSFYPTYWKSPAKVLIYRGSSGMMSSQI